ncbi:MAG: hypothetical protein H0W83_02320 [Planctomycetes bacterium]|nr:hypothetical protein [Planctomycetota bacterium]
MRILICLLCAATSWCAALPDDAAKLVAAFEKKRTEIEAKAAAETAKEQDSLAKSLRKIQERESKAHHSEASITIKNYLDGLGAAPVATAKTNKSFPEFLKDLRVISQVYKSDDIQCGTASISVGVEAVKCDRGLTAAKVIDGKLALMKTCRTRADFDQLVTDLDALPAGAYVIMALQYDTGRDFPDSWIKCLRSLGAKEGLAGHVSYIFIGGKGMRAGEGIEIIGSDIIQYPPVNK